MTKKSFTLHGPIGDFHKMVTWCQKNISNVRLTSYVRASTIPTPQSPRGIRYLYSTIFSAKGWIVESTDNDTFIVTLDNPDHIVMALLTYHSYEWIEDV